MSRAGYAHLYAVREKGRFAKAKPPNKKKESVVGVGDASEEVYQPTFGGGLSATAAVDTTVDAPAEELLGVATPKVCTAVVGIGATQVVLSSDTLYVVACPEVLRKHWRRLRALATHTATQLNPGVYQTVAQLCVPDLAVSSELESGSEAGAGSGPGPVSRSCFAFLLCLGECPAGSSPGVLVFEVYCGAGHGAAVTLVNKSPDSRTALLSVAMRVCLVGV